MQDCLAHGIGATQLHRHPSAPTSYTDAMTVERTGRRTFFHQPGANALLDVNHFDFTHTNARIFHLGYLMLLERLDSFSEEHGRSRASIVLDRAKSAGLETSVDIVSTENPRFREIACSALPFTDHLIINEIEAGKIVGRTLNGEALGDLSAAAEEILSLGVGQDVVVHSEAGAVAVEKNRPPIVQGSLQLPDGFNKGATGAGDAFAAGYLYGVHEGWPMPQRLELAVCAAAACLTDPTPSAGLRSVSQCLALSHEYRPRRI